MLGEGCATIAIGQMAEVNPRRATPSGLSTGTEISFIGMSDVSENGEWANRQTRPLSQVLNGYTTFRDGDVLFAKITPCMENGKGACVDGLTHGVGFGSTEFHVLRAREGYHPRFIYHWTRSQALRRKAEAFMIGSAGQQRVQADFFAAFAVPELTYSEQQRAVEILDTLDDAIRQTEQVIEKLQQLKQGLLHDLLTRGIDENGELRDPERHPEQFNDSPVGWVPRAWQFSQLGRHLRGTPQNGLYKPSMNYGETGTAIVRIDAVNEGVMSAVRTLKRLQITPAEVDLYCLEPGNILVNRVNSIDFVGKTAIVPALSEAVVFESNLMRLRLQQTLLPEFAILWLCSPAAKRHFFRRAKNAIAQASINQGDVLSGPTVAPSLAEQRKIVSLVADLDGRLSQEMSELKKLRSLKQALAHDLLTGRVRVPIPAGAPA